MNRATVGCLAVLLLSVSPVWGALITVDDWYLDPDMPGQVKDIPVTGGENVNGVQFNIQVADGGPENGGVIVGPKITNVDILTGTIFDGNNIGDLGWGSIPGPGPSQLWESWTLTASGTVVAQGLLARVTFDTTGLFAGFWEVAMAPTLNGDSTLFSPEPINVVIDNGSIRLEDGQFPSNASFDGGSDVNSLPINFGTLVPGAPAPAVSFFIWNYAVPGSASLNLDTIVGEGDTSTLTTDLAPFTGLPPGSFNSFTASMDTSTPGHFKAKYTLTFSDVLHLPEPNVLELYLNGSVVPEPSAVVIWSSLGALGLALAAWRRRRGT